MKISIGFVEYLIGLFFFIFLPCYLYHKKTPKYMLTYWPILGMIPGLVLQVRRLYVYIIEVLEVSNMTFVFKGPWFCGLNLLLTAHPANIQHVLCTKFEIFPKGPQFKKIFEIWGDGIFNVEDELWEDLSSSSHVVFNSQEFQMFSVRTSMSKSKNGVVPILENAVNKKIYVDLQDVFQRFLFDTSSIFITGYDPNFLSLEMSDFEVGEVIHGVFDCIFYRHLKPEMLWKFQNWIGFGIEKKMKKGFAPFHQMLEKIITLKREEIENRGIDHHQVLDVLTYYMTVDTAKYKNLRPNNDKFLRDVVLNFMLAAGDTTSAVLTWLFWLLSKHPKVMKKARDEINSKMPMIFDPSKLDKLVYLHSAIFETLRLHPPVPIITKSPKKPEVLPSGHKVDRNWKVLISIYAVGRMKAVWGEDAEEFRPERWITDNGGLRHEPSYKFLGFSSGPRSCLGRKLGLLQIKTAAVELIRNYEFEVIEGYKPNPVPSVVLRMQHGLPVKVTKI